MYPVNIIGQARGLNPAHHMRFESLADFLDPDDAERTFEGHPAEGGLYSYETIATSLMFDGALANSSI